MKDINKFPIKIDIPVRWGDMDAFQHVNNAIYIQWVEVARVEYIRKYLVGSLKDVRLGPILARQDIRYIFPITYPDTVTVGFRVSEIQSDRLICESKIYSQKYDKLSALAYNTVMAYDFSHLRKVDIPTEWSMAIQDVEQ